MSFIILMFSLLTQTAHSAWDIDTICEGQNAENKMTSPLSQRDRDEWCMTAKCQLSHGASESTLCVSHPDHDNQKNKFFTNAVSVSLVHLVQGKELHSSRGKILMTHMLQKGGACFDECRPGVRENAIKKDHTVYGLENPACVSCVSNLPIVKPEIVEIIGHNVKLHKGQKCFHECVIGYGDYTEGEPYNYHCLKCIGAGVALGDEKPVIEYLTTKSGQCWEMSLGNYDKKHAIQIDEAVCKAQSDVYSTYYFLTPAWSYNTMILKKPQECLEMDEKSKGNYYKMPVSMDKCVSDDSMNDSILYGGKILPRNSDQINCR